MEIFGLKCKYCGGEMSEIDGIKSVGRCKYCGSKQTLPKLHDEKRAKLFDRANHMRRNNEFDKAEGLYELILNDDPSDPEAYWSLVLCRFGIEYVEDAKTKERKPTVNRTQITSVFADENYKSAIKYADDEQKKMYEAEANIINSIQRRILEISQKEEAFDVFICYKESDENGKRTEDSVLAYDLYRELTRDGYKVFYARETLHDKSGSAYEPYIFSALNSAKVMVVMGTKKEYFEAAWVRNEWSRFLGQIKKGESKNIIPAYKGFDPYDLPAELSNLQAVNMASIGFMQDIISGVERICKFHGRSDAPVSKPEKPSSPKPEKKPAQQPKVKEVKNKASTGKWKKISAVMTIILVAIIIVCFIIMIQNGEIRFNTGNTDTDNPSVGQQGQQDEYKDLDFTEVDGGYSVKAKEGVKIVGELVIPEKYNGKDIVSVADKAFKDQSSITSVVIPDTVTNIALGSFSGCNSLNKITLPFVGWRISTDTQRWGVFGYIFGDKDLDDNHMESNTSYNKTSSGGYTSQCPNGSGEYHYFAIPQSLRTVVITSQENVPDYAFTNCDLIESITFEKPLKSIGESAFENCSALKSADISEGITVIPYRAFKNCSSLTSITIPDSVNTINRAAFYGCNGLTTVSVPGSVKSVGSNVFGRCTNLESITLPFIGSELSCDTARWSVFGYIFGDGNDDGNMSSSQSVTKTSGGGFTSQVTEDNSNWFYYDIPMKLKTVVITQQQDIPNYAFNNCDMIESITFEKPLKSIGESVFENCSALKSADISEGITVIPYRAFKNCSSLTSITIPESVVKISHEAFHGCMGLTTVTVPDSVKFIGSSAFGRCTGLESITLPFIGSELSCDTARFSVLGYIFGDGNDDGYMNSSQNITKTSGGGYTSQVSEDGSNWFYYVIPMKLKTVVITQQQDIPNYAFNNCDMIESITFEKPLKSIGESAFENCSALKSADISEGITVIPYRAFKNCSSLTSITIPESVVKISHEVFHGCMGLTTVTVPDSVKLIGSSAFGRCTGLESITLPFIGRELSCDTARWSVFGYIFGDGNDDDNMSSSQNITKTSGGGYTSQVSEDGSNWFYYDIPITLKTVVITQQTKVPDNAFYNCDLITKITFSKKISSFGTNSFEKCTAEIDG